MKKLLVFIISVLAFAPLPAESDPLWLLINGKWESYKDKKAIVDDRQKAIEFGYTELINNNSLVTQKTLSGVTSIQTSVTFLDPIGDNSGMIFLTEESFLFFHAFRFTGSKKKLDRIQFIKSEIRDPSLPRDVKGNFVITVLAEADTDISFGAETSYTVAIDGKKAALLVNGKKVLAGNAERDLSKGKFGFSHKNNRIRITLVKALAGETTVFEDNFSEDRIYRTTVKAKKE